MKIKLSASVDLINKIIELKRPYKYKKYEKDRKIYDILKHAMYLNGHMPSCIPWGWELVFELDDYMNFASYLATWQGEYANELRRIFPELTGMINDLMNLQDEK